VTLFAATDLARCFAYRTRFAGIAVFLLVAGTASRADASCGDWLAGNDAMPGHSAAQNDGHPKAPVPCDGPACRRSREHAPAVPPAPVRRLDNTERWCRLAEELASRPSLFTLVEPEADASPLTGFRLSIERPPRG
jgi:hypothetical protein